VVAVVPSPTRVVFSRVAGGGGWRGELRRVLRRQMGGGVGVNRRMAGRQAGRQRRRRVVAVAVPQTVGRRRVPCATACSQWSRGGTKPQTGSRTLARMHSPRLISGNLIPLYSKL